MTNAEKAKFKCQAGVLKSLAHPTRLFIVEELSKGERCVCELTDMVGVEMPTISRHLSLLKNAGVIVDDKRGTQVFYRLTTPCVMKFLKCMAGIEPSFSRKT